MHPTSSASALISFCVLLSVSTTSALSQDLAKYSPSFIKGILEGCIDGQKASLRKQGIPYTPNEENVRQYCHCMAPTTADISFTTDGRQKLLAGDPEVKKRVQKAEAICLDGINNGRKFAPPLTLASPNPSYGSQQNAYGRIIGTYWSALSVTEVCLEYPGLRVDAKAVAKSYTSSNKSLYGRIEKRMLELATESGGDTAAKQLQAEVQQMISNKAEMQSDVRKTASSEAMCSTMLKNLKAGLWDIAQRNPREMRLILGN